MLDSRFTLSRPPPQAAPFSDEKAFHRISPRFQQRQQRQGPAVVNVGASQGLHLQNSARTFAVPLEQIAQQPQQTFQALSEQVQHVVSENDAMLQSLAAQNQAAEENQNLRQQVRNLQQLQQPDITPTQQLQLLNQQSIHQQTLIDQYQLALRKLTGEIKRLKDAQAQPQEAFQQTEAAENAACQTDLAEIAAPVDASRLLLSSNEALQENNELLRRENAKLLDQLNQLQASAQNAANDEIINKLNDQLEQTCAANQEVVDRLKSKIEQAQQLAGSRTSAVAVTTQSPLVAFLIANPLRPADLGGFLDQLSRILTYCRELQYYSGQQAKSAQYFAEMVRFLYSKFMRFQQEVAVERDRLKEDLRGVLEGPEEGTLKTRLQEVLARH